MKHNPELGCNEIEFLPNMREILDMRREELTHSNGCYNCANSKYCWEATRLGFACDDWEEKHE
jgi:hypothetical protein